MQILQPEVRSTVDSIHKELFRKANVPAPPEQPAEVGTTGTPEGSSIEHVSAMAIAIQDKAADRIAEVSAKPVRGVVLEFATRLRQSRGREVLLND
jgi:predicted secreted protein